MSASDRCLDAGTRRSSSSASARAVVDDIQLELECHLDLSADDLIAAGASPEDAQWEALRRFGDLDTIAGRCLAQKLRGEHTMKTIIAILVAALILVTSAFAFATITMRQQMAARYESERVHVAALKEVDRREVTLLLGAEDQPRAGDRIKLVTSGDARTLMAAVTVDAGGMILLPELGRVSVTDTTRAGLEAMVNERYAQFYEAPLRIYVALERTETLYGR